MSELNDSRQLASPSPTRPVGNFARPTKASQSMSPGVAAHEKGAPNDVQSLTQMSPQERIKREWESKRQQRESSAKRPGALFAQGPKREGLLGRGNLAVKTEKMPEFKTEQQRRAWLLKQEKQRKVEAECPSYTPPEPRVYSSENWKEPMQVKKEKQGTWSKSTEERFGFNFSTWNKFPQATPQKSLQHRAPGPGSYGKSTSFVGN